jgi:Yip1-like protein
MTEPSSVAAPTASAPPKGSFWEDLIDIYLSPAAVFRRNENKSVWPPLLFVALAIGVIFFFTFNTLQPIFDAEFAKGMAKAGPQAAQAPPEALEKIKNASLNVTRYGLSVIMIVTMFVLGAVSWMIGKLVGSAQTFHAALVVAAWSYMPRVLGSVINGVQGLLLDPASLTSQLSISLSPARFMAPDTPNPLVYQLLGRFDLITIWVTILLAIGLYVTGKVSKGRAATFGVLIWLVGALPALRQAFAAM